MRVAIVTAATHSALSRLHSCSRARLIANSMNVGCGGAGVPICRESPLPLQCHRDALSRRNDGGAKETVGGTELDSFDLS